MNTPTPPSGVPTLTDDRVPSSVAPFRTLYEATGRLLFGLLWLFFNFISYLVILATPLRFWFVVPGDETAFSTIVGSIGLTGLIMGTIDLLMRGQRRTGWTLVGMLSAVAVGLVVVIVLLAFLSWGWIPFVLGCLFLGMVWMLLRLSYAQHYTDRMPASASASGQPDIARILDQILAGYESAPGDPRMAALKRTILGARALSREIEDEVELQKQRVRYAHYISEEVRLKAQAMGYLVGEDQVHAAVWNWLFERRDPDPDDPHMADRY